MSTEPAVPQFSHRDPALVVIGRTDALERAARAEADASGKDREAARNDLKLEITRAFWAVVTARETVGVVEESVRRMNATVADVRNRFGVGLAPPNDVSSAEAQAARQQMLLIQARNTLAQARTDLRRLAGLAPDTPIAVEDRLEAPPRPIPDPAPLVEEARATRPDRQALEARVTGASERREAAVASKRPVLTVGGGFDYARPNTRIFPRSAEWNTSWDASVNLSWTFWDFGRARADIVETTATQLAARERLAEFDTRLEVEVRQRRLDIESARASVSAADEAVRAATEGRRVVGDRFAEGVATSTEVLDAQVLLLQAGLDRTLALANVRLAEAQLDRALGR